ncbi:MAG: hypothetical protein H7296_10020 [Bacteroidia bacterium]|nr:hypothetical protein [Bacteroidia bacterium]
MSIYLSNWFDLNRDLNSFYTFLKKINHLHYMGDAFNSLRFVGRNDLFDALQMYN